LHRIQGTRTHGGRARRQGTATTRRRCSAPVVIPHTHGEGRQRAGRCRSRWGHDGQAASATSVVVDHWPRRGGDDVDLMRSVERSSVAGRARTVTGENGSDSSAVERQNGMATRAVRGMGAHGRHGPRGAMAGRQAGRQAGRATMTMTMTMTMTREHRVVCEHSETTTAKQRRRCRTRRRADGTARTAAHAAFRRRHRRQHATGRRCHAAPPPYSRAVVRIHWRGEEEQGNQGASRKRARGRRRRREKQTISFTTPRGREEKCNEGRRLPQPPLSTQH
jgi:hypothetical protein